MSGMVTALQSTSDPRGSLSVCSRRSNPVLCHRCERRAWSWSVKSRAAQVVPDGERDHAAAGAVRSWGRPQPRELRFQLLPLVLAQLQTRAQAGSDVGVRHVQLLAREDGPRERSRQRLQLPWCVAVHGSETRGARWETRGSRHHGRGPRSSGADAPKGLRRARADSVEASAGCISPEEAGWADECCNDDGTGSSDTLSCCVGLGTAQVASNGQWLGSPELIGCYYEGVLYNQGS